jgi:hypothetical protein
MTPERTLDTLVNILAEWLLPSDDEILAKVTKDGLDPRAAAETIRIRALRDRERIDPPLDSVAPTFYKG